jgi:receptor protein-tyrosine kinase
MEETLRQLGPRADQLAAVRGVAADRPVTVAQRLVATPVSGTTRVDLSYSDPNQQLAEALLSTYAATFVKARNQQVAALQKRTLDALFAQANALHDQVVRWSRQVDAERRASITGSASTLSSTELDVATRRYQTKAEQIDKITNAAVLNGTPTAVAGPVVVGPASGGTSRALLLAIGLVLGLIGGIAAALLLEAFRTRLVSPDEVEEAAGAPVVAAIPRQGRATKGVTVIEQPYGPAAEGYMRARAALQLRGLGESTRTLAVLSAEPSAGKSSLVANLACSLARQGSPTVVVSGDLRRPRLDRYFGLLGRPGLAELLAGSPGTDLRSLLVEVDRNLFVLPSGQADRNPAELLLGARLPDVIRGLRDAGVVLVDTPPAQWSADALALASATEASVLVARAGHTKREDLEDLVDNLRQLGLRRLGVVLLGARSPLSTYQAQRYVREGNEMRLRSRGQPRPLEAPAPPPATEGTRDVPVRPHGPRPT